MELKEHLQDLTESQRESLAEAAKTTVAYLYQLAGKHRKASAQLCLRIETATNGKVTREGLRPEFYPPPLKKGAAA